MIRDDSGKNRIMVTGRFERTVSMRDGSEVPDVVKFHGC